MSDDRVGVNLKYLFIWLFVCCVLWLFDSIGWFGWLKHGVERGISPISGVSYRVVATLNAPVEAIRFFRSGTERIVDLEARLAEKLVTQAQVDTLTAENRALKEQLDAPLPGEWQMIPAPVLGYQNGVLVIKAGSVEGVAEGMSVVYQEIYLGKVSKVSKGISEVMTLSHSESKVSARVSNRNTSGLVVYDKGLVVLDQILQGSEIQEGEVVVTAGTDGVAPLLTIGRINQIISGQNDIFKRVVVTPAVTPSELTSVFVIRDYDEAEK